MVSVPETVLPAGIPPLLGAASLGVLVVSPIDD